MPGGLYVWEGGGFIIPGGPLWHAITTAIKLISPRIQQARSITMPVHTGLASFRNVVVGLNQHKQNRTSTSYFFVKKGYKVLGMALSHRRPAGIN